MSRLAITPSYAAVRFGSCSSDQIGRPNVAPASPPNVRYGCARGCRARAWQLMCAKKLSASWQSRVVSRREPVREADLADGPPALHRLGDRLEIHGALAMGGTGFPLQHDTERDAPARRSRVTHVRRRGDLRRRLVRLQEPAELRAGHRIAADQL